MATVASIIVALEAQNAQFSAAIKSAQRDVQSLQAAAEKGDGGFFSKLAIGLSVGAGIGLVTGAVGELNGTISGAVSTIQSWVEATAGAALEHQKVATRLGISSTELQGWENSAKRAGLEAGTMDRAVSKLNEVIGKAVTEGGDSKAVFDRLGLSAQQLAAESSGQRMREVADAIQKQGNSALQAASATELFGKAGHEAFGVFAKGAAGLDEAIARGQKFGTILSDLDTARLADVQRSIGEINARFDGIKNQFAIVLAPAIEAVAVEIAKLIPPADQVRIYVAGAFEVIAVSAAMVQDQLKGVEVALLHAAAIAATVASKIPGSVGNGAKEAATFLDGMAGKLEHSRSAVVNLSEFLARARHDSDIHAKATAAIPKPPPPLSADDSDKVRGVFAKLKEEYAALGKPKEIADLQNLNASVAKIEEARRMLDEIAEKKIKLEVDKSITDLAKQFTDARTAADAMRQAIYGAGGIGALANANHGQIPGSVTEDAKKLADLAAKGATQGDIDTAKKYLDSQHAQEKYLDAVNRAKEVYESAKGPLDKYQDAMANLNELQKKGLIGQETYQAAAAKANKDLLSAAGAGGPSQHAAAEVRRFDFTLARDNPASDPMTQLLEQQKRNAKAAEEAAAHLRDIKRFQQNADTDRQQASDYGL